MAQYKDLQGRVISQTAYDTQKAEGKNVSGYQKLDTAVDKSLEGKVQPAAPLDVNSDMYKRLIAAGGTPEDIQASYDKIINKNTQTPQAPSPIDTSAP
jgi:hypothetical protein